MADDAAQKKLDALAKLLDKKQGEVEKELKTAKAAKGKIDGLARDAAKVVEE